MRKFFFVHVTGQCPYALDLWLKPYASESMARMQGRRCTHDKNGARKGDFVAKVYRVEFPVTEALGFLTEIPDLPALG